MRKYTVIITLFVVAVMLHGCASKVPYSYTPQPKSLPVPSRKESAVRYVPPTQRPYTIDGKTYYPIPSAYGYEEIGVASWYGPQFHGRKTSNGETYDMRGLTAAHKILPMNTRVLVKNLTNGKEIVLRVNDRGPFAKERVIDLSLGGARALGVDGPGTAKVRVTALGEAERTLVRGQVRNRFVSSRDFNEGEFYVQIGAFTSRDNANRLKEVMVSQGSKAIAQVYDQADGTRYYRVQVWVGCSLDVAKSEELDWQRRYPGSFVIAR
ncbi:MAG: septal ring lytic transglycosylase RlpA family protein [Proteobacteria bacterium]|nr:septal ring lytic transglycosylase RlpA family protein [Desulfobulbaceae bacterium]MBU4151524.1 septal ring lytic transglycosylase RlpA family protein [Pseudomonadota bacterium]MDP2105879.1 septal ring lytic transglycosylase RlpA family protein [Desulfobulbaceae bacterium]